MPEPLDTHPRARAIAMWDFSWLERRFPGGGYEDWEAALDGLVLRGYDVVRIDAYPHLVADRKSHHELLPIWNQHVWGSPAPIRVSVRDDLVEFIRLAKERGILIALSSWFREDRSDIRRRIRAGEDLANVWAATLDAIDEAGLLDAIWFVDLCNEWPQSAWAPFLFDRAGDTRLTRRRSEPEIRSWVDEAIAALRKRTNVPLCLSVSDRIFDYATSEDHSGVDLLEPHLWVAQGHDSEFYARLGYDLLTSNFDEAGYDILAERAERVYRDDEDHWRARLAESIEDVARLSRRTNLPLVTSEGWAIVNWRDGPGLEWAWVKELTAFGVVEALKHGRWVAVATSNFCGPQFRGMWDDIVWHQELTSLIHSTPCPPGRLGSAAWAWV